MKLNRVDICVKNLEESVKFYEDAFNFKTLRVFETGMGKAAFMKNGDFTLAVFESEKFPVGILTLGADADKDIEESIADLNEKGAQTIVKPQQAGLGKVAKVCDPNGIAITITQVNVDGIDSGKRITEFPNK